MKIILFKNRIKDLALIFILFSFVECATLSSFDQQAYLQTTSIKVDALNIMDLAIEDYGTNEKSLKEFETKLQKVYEYEKNRPKNEITLMLWDKLLDPNGHLLGGVLSRWKNEKKLGATFINESKKLVDKAFDQILGLESKKIKASDIPK